MKRIIITTVVMQLWLLCSGNGALWAEDNEGMRSLDIGKIVISSSKVEEPYAGLPVNVSVVEYQEIQDSGATEVTELLDRLPSVHIINYGSDGSAKSVHIRGLSGPQVLTLLDGIPVNTPRDGTADLNALDLNNIEKIEVLRGPASSVYGSSAMGGVINIITKDGKTHPKTTVKVKYGTYDTRGITLAHGKDLNKFDYYFSHDSYKTDGHRVNSDYEYHNTSLKLGYDPRDDERLTFRYGYYQSELGSLGPNYWIDSDDRQESWRENFDLNWKKGLREDLDLSLKAYHTIDRLEFIENLATDDVDAHHTKLYGGDVQLTWKIFDSFRCTSGYTFQEHGLNSSSSGKHEYNLNAIYAEGEIEPLERLKFYLGARYDDYSNFGSKVSPSGRFSWWLNDNFKIHGLYGRSFRVPTFNDLYWPREDWGIFGGVEGNLDLKEEQAQSFEFGISTYFFKALWTDVTYFRTLADDLIIWNVDDTMWWRPQNLNSAILQGVELNSDFIIWRKIKANVNYSYLYAKNKDTKNWLIYRPQHQCKVNLNYKTDNDWTFDWAYRYVSKRYTVDNNQGSLTDYWVVDASLGKKFLDSWEVQLSGKNIFDHDYEEESGYFMPGPQVLTSVKCEF